MAVDLLAKRDIIETIIPVAGYPAIGRVSGVSGAWDAYGEIITAADLATLCPGGFILCGAYVLEAFNLVAADVDVAHIGQLNLQVCTGAAASEVLVAESNSVLVAYATVTTATGLSVMTETGRTHFFEPKLIPASTRLSYRTSCSDSKLIRTGLYLFGYDARYFAQPLKAIEELRYIRGLCSPTQGAKVWPSPGATTVTSSTPAGTYGAAVVFEAHADSPLLITGLVGSNDVLSIHGHAQIGIGANPNEQWMSMVGIPCIVNYFSVGDCYLPRPLYVKTGEVVSVRIATSVATKHLHIGLKGYALK